MSLNSYGKNRQYPLEDSFLERRVKLMNGYTNWFKNYRNTKSTINFCEQHKSDCLFSEHFAHVYDYALYRGIFMGVLPDVKKASTSYSAVDFWYKDPLEYNICSKLTNKQIKEIERYYKRLPFNYTTKDNKVYGIPHRTFVFI